MITAIFYKCNLLPSNSMISMIAGIRVLSFHGVLRHRQHLDCMSLVIGMVGDCWRATDLKGTSRGMIKEGLRKTGINCNLSEVDELAVLLVTHPLLSRLVYCCSLFLMMPSIATKFQYVNSPFFIFLLTHYMFRPLRAIFRWDILLDVFKDCCRLSVSPDSWSISFTLFVAKALCYRPECPKFET
jgi:hypothetical protein